MNKNGPIVLIEDDEDDQMLLTQIFWKLNYSNEIIFFKAKDALEYFIHSPDEPLLILSDINMPVTNGIDLRTHIKSQDYIGLKCIPFLLIT